MNTGSGDVRRGGWLALRGDLAASGDGFKYERHCKDLAKARRSAGNTAAAALAKLSSRPEVASLLSKEMIPCAAEKHIIG